jgi:hypothetical protein
LNFELYCAAHPVSGLDPDCGGRSREAAGVFRIDFYGYECPDGQRSIIRRNPVRDDISVEKRAPPVFPRGKNPVMDDRRGVLHTPENANISAKGKGQKGKGKHEGLPQQFTPTKVYPNSLSQRFKIQNSKFKIFSRRFAPTIQNSEFRIQN